MHKRIVILVSLLTITCVAQQPDRRLEIYGTLGLQIDVLSELANAILDGNGKVIPDPQGGRLLVLASPEYHERLREAFSQTKASIRNVQIKVSFLQNGQDRSTGAALDGEIVITSEGTRINASPSLQYNNTQTTQNTEQLLVASSGREASLRIGESIPYLEWTADFQRYQPTIHAGTRWLEVGAFLTFRPTIQPDGQTIHIDLVPEIRGKTDNGETLATRFTTLKTQITARNGETIHIGDWSEANQIYNTFLIGTNRRNTSNNLNILLTASILP